VVCHDHHAAIAETTAVCHRCCFVDGWRAVSAGGSVRGKRAARTVVALPTLTSK
jgi:hypothetical protein